MENPRPPSLRKSLRKKQISRFENRRRQLRSRLDLLKSYLLQSEARNANDLVHVPGGLKNPTSRALDDRQLGRKLAKLKKIWNWAIQTNSANIKGSFRQRLRMAHMYRQYEVRQAIEHARTRLQLLSRVSYKLIKKVLRPETSAQKEDRQAFAWSNSENVTEEYFRLQSL